MADVQRHLEDFHDAIRLTDENETLREKRDAVLRKLDSGLVKIFEDREEDSPTYTTINRGSYAMHTGVVPLEGDYDIDVGVIFDVCKDDYPDPVEVKLWVYDALDGYTGNVDIKQPCVTVQYQINEEPVYHVDLAVYGYDSSSSESLYLARGKPYSRSENKIWEPAAPKELLSLIREYSSDPADRRQFRRVIRYLKRWKDLTFPSDGNGAPIGIGITVAAHRWFQPTYRLVVNHHDILYT
jgi:predicted nucleotidyltransferase